eukprot:4346839-Lingulodinium_polyedra.AAC.1
MQTELRWAVVIKHVVSNKFILLKGQLQTHIQALERNTGECIHAAVKETLSRPDIVEDLFKTKVRIACADEFGANDVAERAEMFDKDGSWCHVRSTCQIHKNAGVAKGVNKIMQDDTSGLLNAMLSLDIVGNQRLFRDILFSVIES